MNIQSLSVVVPSDSCINNCKFCVSKMRDKEYENMLVIDNIYSHLYEKDYKERLEFARDNGCNTVMLTGQCEPQQNMSFLKTFGPLNRNLSNPFKVIEMQTTGVLLDNDYLYFLRHHVGVKTISLSISSFSDVENAEIVGMPEGKEVELKKLCKAIKKYRFNLRLSINLTDSFDEYSSEDIFTYCKEVLLADQVTFRVLFAEGSTDEAKWVEENSADEKGIVRDIINYTLVEGEPLERLEYGQIRYSVNGISTVLDDDCMADAIKESIKYLILRENCKLYTKWNDKGSLLF